jgi:predicted AAA+ superfamily ATPase
LTKGQIQLNLSHVSLHPVLEEKLLAALQPIGFSATRRDATLPDVPGKVHSVIGMRRTGKTTFLRQLQDVWRSTVPPERVVYLSFDDDRLLDLPLDQLNALLEAYYRHLPEARGRETVYWLLDEIHLVAGWDRFVRRIVDTEAIEVVVSGSSARMLSREVHTALRGRGMETIIRPFSFREFLRHRGEEPTGRRAASTSAERSRLEKRLLEFLEAGGFPEAQGLGPRLRIELLQHYVDTVLFRDVVERYRVSQVAALRWLTRHCLRNPASTLSLHRFHRDLRSQGLGVTKDAVYALVGHLVDAFLITLVSLATESETRQRSNPRKVYPADPGMIRAFDTSGRGNIGHALETAVLHELQRRKLDVGYVKAPNGLEVDFLARDYDGAQQLIQVCADPSEGPTLDRELAGLAAGRDEYPRASQHLIVLTAAQMPRTLPGGIHAQPAFEWLLGSVTR